jgi:hypothetical protein
VYGVDFRNLTALEWFCSYVIANYDRLDVIVNNAAQTVRRPPAYYAHLVEGEKMLTYTAGFDDDISSSSSSSDNGSSSTSGSSSSGNGAGSSSSSSSCDPVRSSESTSEEDVDRAGRERVRSVLRHQQRYSSSLSAAVEAAEGTGAGAGAASRIEEIGAGAGAGIDMQGDVKSVVLNDTDASFVTVSGQPKTRDVQMTPAISSSEMTQLILTKVNAFKKAAAVSLLSSLLLYCMTFSSSLSASFPISLHAQLHHG